MAHIGGPKKVPIVAGLTQTSWSCLSSISLLVNWLGLSVALVEQHSTSVSGFLGEGAAGMDAQALGYCWMILLIILGNIGYLLSRRQSFAGGAHQ